MKQTRRAFLLRTMPATLAGVAASQYGLRQPDSSLACNPKVSDFEPRAVTFRVPSETANLLVSHGQCLTGQGTNPSALTQLERGGRLASLYLTPALKFMLNLPNAQILVEPGNAFSSALVAVQSLTDTEIITQLPAMVPGKDQRAFLLTSPVNLPGDLVYFAHHIFADEQQAHSINGPRFKFSIQGFEVDGQPASLRFVGLSYQGQAPTAEFIDRIVVPGFLNQEVIYYHLSVPRGQTIEVQFQGLSSHYADPTLYLFNRQLHDQALEKGLKLLSSPRNLQERSQEAQQLFRQMFDTAVLIQPHDLGPAFSRHPTDVVTLQYTIPGDVEAREYVPNLFIRELETWFSMPYLIVEEASLPPAKRSASRLSAAQAQAWAQREISSLRLMSQLIRDALEV